MAGIELTGRRLNQYIENYVVFDFETTGVDTQEDSIIEISAVKVRNHVITDQFSRLINPGTHIPAGATKINGITDEMVKEAPGLTEVLPEFLSFIEGEVLIGHNIQSFDLLFLYRVSEEILGISLPNDYIDTLYMAKERLPQLYRHRLTDISEHFDIPTEGAHRALQDCMMNQQCYEQMGKLSGTGKEFICPQCGSLLKKRNGKFGVFYGCSNYPQCRFTKNG